MLAQLRNILNHCWNLPCSVYRHGHGNVRSASQSSTKSVCSLADFHLVNAGLVILSFLCGLVSAFAGLTLRANRPSARTVALVAPFLSVSKILFGTTLAIYTLIALIFVRVEISKLGGCVNSFFTIADRPAISESTIGSRRGCENCLALACFRA